MEGVKISQYGLAFVLECFRRYLGDSWEIAAVCLAGMLTSTAVVFARGWRKKREAVTLMNWVLIAVLALTVYNPFLAVRLVPRLGMNTVFYRAFWALPLLPAAAYYLTELVNLPERKTVRLASGAAVIAAAALMMPLNPGVRYHLQLPDNIYKVNGAIPVICETIHDDFEQSDQYKARLQKAENTDPTTKKGARAFVLTMPRCVFSYELEFQVRQYDPSVTLTFSRNMRLFYEGNTSTGASYTNTSKAYQRRKMILDAMYGRDPSIRIPDFQEAMQKTRTQYLIVESTQASADFLTAAGCQYVGDQAGYSIYSYGLTKGAS